MTGVTALKKPHTSQEGIAWMGTGASQWWWTTIRSCLHCFINKSSSTKPMSAKGSRILALLSMKWDWKMILNGLLNWRNDVLWSFTLKPPLETCVFSVKNSSKTQVLYTEPKLLNVRLEVSFSISVLEPWSLKRLPSLFSYFIPMSTCRKRMFVRTYTFRTQKTLDFLCTRNKII